MKKEMDQTTALLWRELESENPSEEKIRLLVLQGAIITGEFLKEAIYCLVPPSDMEDYRGKPKDMKYFKLLIQLGADVNFEEDGFNALYEAALSWNVELTQILLDKGANPNCISTETNESILSYVSGDQWYEAKMMDRGGSKPLAEIRDLLKKYGGQFTHEIFTSQIIEYARICDNYPTGIITLKGNIRMLIQN
jgi:flagellar motor protein MotB